MTRAPSRTARACRKVGAFSWTHAWSILLASFALAAGAAVYAAKHLHIETSRNALLSPDNPSTRRYFDYLRDFTVMDDIIVAIQSDDLAESKRFATELAAELRKDTRRFEKVIARIDPKSLEARGLLYLSREELADLRLTLEDNRELLGDVARASNVERIFAAIDAAVSRAMVGELLGDFLTSRDEHAPKKPVDLSFLRALVAATSSAARGAPASTASPWDGFFVRRDSRDRDGFLVSDGAQFVFILVRANAAGKAESFAFLNDAISNIRSRIRALCVAHPRVTAGVTGMDALSADEMRASSRDGTRATLITIVGALFLFWLYFRQPGPPLLSIVALLMAMTWTAGAATLLVGHLNVLSLSLMPILIGLGVDFGIHILARQQEALPETANFRASFESAFETAGPGILAAVATTAAAFFALMLTDFIGLRELGLIAGTGVLLGLVGSFTTFPALVSIASGRRERSTSSIRRVWPAPIPAGTKEAAARFADALDRHARTILVVCLASAIVAALLLPKITFDFDLLALQAEETESAVWEKKLFSSSTRSMWYAVSIASTLEETRKRQARFAELPTVSSVESIADAIPVEQAEKLRDIASLSQALGDLPIEKPQPTAIDLGALDRTLDSLQFKLREEGLEDGKAADRPNTSDIREMRRAIRELGTALATTGARERLEDIQRAWIDDLSDRLAVLRNASDAKPIEVAELPADLLTLFVGKSGRHLIRVFAKENIWKQEPMERFLHDIASVDPDATGSPGQTYEAGMAMRDGYIRAGGLALVAIFAIVLLEFRSLRSTLLAMAPLLVGSLWTTAAMVLFRIDFNLANLVLLPLIVGVGIDSGIHLVHRRIEDGRGNFRLALTGTGIGIQASALTTMLGFGSLLVADHRGIFSIGLVLTIGIGCVLAACFIFLPSLFGATSRRST